MPLDAALYTFAGELGDAAVDEAIAPLILASRFGGSDLQSLLATAAANTRDQIALWQRTEIARAKPRRDMRLVIAVTLVFTVGVLLVGHGYFKPFGTPVGQIVLLAVAGLFAAGFVAMNRLSRPHPMPRLFDSRGSHAPAETGSRSTSRPVAIVGRAGRVGLDGRHHPGTRLRCRSGRHRLGPLPAAAHPPGRPRPSLRRTRDRTDRRPDPRGRRGPTPLRAPVGDQRRQGPEARRHRACPTSPSPARRPRPSPSRSPATPSGWPCWARCCGRPRGQSGCTSASSSPPWGPGARRHSAWSPRSSTSTRRPNDAGAHFCHSLSTYASLVSMAMAGAMGWSSALEVASTVSSTDWAMAEVAQSLLWAQAYRKQPWEGLERLAVRFDLPDLTDLARSMAQAGDGARIRDSLEAKAQSLRLKETSALEDTAQATTQKMLLPGVLLMAGYGVLVFYPALASFTGAHI